MSFLGIKSFETASYEFHLLSLCQLCFLPYDRLNKPRIGSRDNLNPFREINEQQAGIFSNNPAIE